jgi:hypothetical protein
MQHPVVPPLLMKIFRESGMAPPRCIAAITAAPAAATWVLAAVRAAPPYSVVADPVMELVAVLPHVATSAVLCTPPNFLPVLASVGHPATVTAAATAAATAVHLLAGNPSLPCVARTTRSGFC